MEEINREIGLDVLLASNAQGNQGHGTHDEKERKEIAHHDGEVNEKVE